MGFIENEMTYDKPKTVVETVADFLRKSIIWEFFVIALYIFQM